MIAQVPMAEKSVREWYETLDKEWPSYMSGFGERATCHGSHAAGKYHEFLERLSRYQC
jgi:hypothetical protein